MTKSSVFLRLLLLILILGPLAYVGYLNQAYFLATTSLHLALEQPEQVAFSYDSPELSNAFYWAACVFLGMLIAALRSLPKQLRARRQIRQLSATQAAQGEEIARLKAEVTEREASSHAASEAGNEDVSPGGNDFPSLSQEEAKVASDTSAAAKADAGAPGTAQP